MPQYTETPLVGSPQQQPVPGDSTNAAQPMADPESGHVRPMLLEETEEPQMSVPVSVGLLVAVTVVSLPITYALDGEGNRPRSGIACRSYCGVYGGLYQWSYGHGGY